MNELPGDLKRELDKFQLWNLYNSLPADLRTLVGTYLREHLISVEAPTLPLSEQELIPFIIRIGEYTFQGHVTLVNLHYLLVGGYLTLDWYIKIYPPNSGPRPVNRMEVHNERTGESIYFPAYIYEILEKKIIAFFRASKVQSNFRPHFRL